MRYLALALLLGGCGSSLKLAPREAGFIRVIATCKGEVVQYNDLEPGVPFQLFIPNACNTITLEVQR